MEALTPFIEEPQKKIFKQVFCHYCQEKKQHISVETIEGVRFACEVCGSIADSEYIEETV